MRREEGKKPREMPKVPKMPKMNDAILIRLTKPVNPRLGFGPHGAKLSFQSSSSSPARLEDGLK
jgi:hypothetical protein